MPAKMTSSAPNKEPNTKDFVQDYLADWGSDEDPFRSPSPKPGAGGAGANKNTGSKKRKGDDTLGLEELDVTKKARVPRVKLDETRLLSEKGIPELQKRAKKLRLKGKGHEFSDAARLLSFYQQWLDDLFPKAAFLDALAMVEKVGHKTLVKNQRLKWIDEGKPKPAMSFDDDEDPFRDGSAVPRQASRIAPIFEKSKSAAHDHPDDDDLFGDNDIYNASPRQTVQPQAAGGGDVPDEDDLDALMAEAEAEGNGVTQVKATTRATIPKFGSIFGDGGGTSAAPNPISHQGPSGEPDEEDMDALLAEAEARSAPGPARSISGGGPKPNTARSPVELDDDDDLDALMAEAEAQAPPAASRPAETTASSTKAVAGDKAMEVEKNKATAGQDYGDDDLDALIAKAEGLESGSPKPSGSKEHGTPRKEDSFADDEEAMAEMEGLW